MPDETAVVPDVGATGLDRADLEDAAEDLGLETVDGASDQELFERIAVELGEVDEGELEAAAAQGPTTPGPSTAPSAGVGARTWSFLGIELHLGGFRVALAPEAHHGVLGRALRRLLRATT